MEKKLDLIFKINILLLKKVFKTVISQSEILNINDVYSVLKCPQIKVS